MAQGGNSNGDERVLFKISRKSLLRDSKRNLEFCLTPLQSSLTLSSLENLYREETENELSGVAAALGYASVSVMLDSSEFSDTIEHHFDDSLMERVYRLKFSGEQAGGPINVSFNSSRPVLNTIESQRNKRSHGGVSDVLLNDNSIRGRERLLRIIAKLGGEKKNILLVDVQKLYYVDYGVLLDKAELRRHFSMSHIKQVFDVYMKNEVEVTVDPELTGSLYFKLKTPFSEVMSRNAQTSANSFLSENNSKSAIDDIFSMNGRAEKTESTSAGSSLQYFNGTSTSHVEQPINQDKFALNDNVKRAYGLHNLDDFSSETTPFVKEPKEKKAENNAESIFANSAESTKTNQQNSSLAALDALLLGTKADHSSTPSNNASRSYSLMDMDLNELNNANKMSTEQILNTFATNTTSDNNKIGRPIGNAQELEQILAVSSRKYTQFSSTNDSGRSSNGSVKEKPKYTKRCEGTFTDEESSEDEFEAGNREVRLEQNGNNFLNEVDLSLRKAFADIDDNDDDIVVNNGEKRDEFIDTLDTKTSDIFFLEQKQEGCHADKFLRLAKIRQEESEARRMAHRIAQYQKNNPGATVADIVAFTQKQQPNRSAFNAVPPSKSVTQPLNGIQQGIRANSRVSSISVFSGNDHNIANPSAGQSEIDGDFLNQLPSRVRPASQSLFDSDMCGLNNGLSSLVFPGNENAENDLTNESYILAATISIIVMNRKPSITLTDLKHVLEITYGRKLEAGKDFFENNWEVFIEKYCNNIFAIKVPSNVLYVWKAQGDANFKEIVAKVGKFCAQK